MAGYYMNLSKAISEEGVACAIYVQYQLEYTFAIILCQCNKCMSAVVCEKITSPIDRVESELQA